LSFQSFSVKFGVILKEANFQFDPFSFPFSNFKMETEFENGLKRKVAGLI
jgi:hypothetical protein